MQNLRILTLRLLPFLVLMAIFALWGYRYFSHSSDVPVPEIPLIERVVLVNETLESILLSEGSPHQEIHDLTEALRPLIDPRRLQPGQKLVFRFAEAGHLEFLSYRASPTEIYEVRWVESPEKTGFVAQKLTVPVELKREGVKIQLTSSLYESLIEAGENPALVSHLVDILAWDMDFYSDPRQGDIVNLVVEKQYIDGQFYKYGRVISVDYQGAVVQQKAFYFAEQDGYYDEKGQSMARSFLKSPVKYSRISSKFGGRRHPITHHYHQHLGTDYVAPTGTPVWAMASGRITQKAYNGLNGRYLVVRHSNGYETYYLHLSRFEKGMNVGRRVAQKEVIGYVGTTGRSSGPHLHLSVKQHGRFINPLKMQRVKQEALKGEHLAAFQLQLEGYLTELATLPAPLFQDMTASAENTQLFQK